MTETTVNQAAERLDVKDKRLYDLEFAVLDTCFDKSVRPCALYYLPEEYQEELYGSFHPDIIRFNRKYWEEYGADAYTATTMFHELVHAWCTAHGVEDTKADYHTEQYKKACEDHGGVCYYNNQEDGYNIVWLTKDTLARILAAYEARQEERRKRKEFFPAWYVKEHPELF